MKCKLCESNIKLKAYFSYECPNCNHIYVDYKQDGLKYHQKNYRRNNHGTRGVNEIKNGKFTKQFHQYRLPIVEKRIEYLKEYIDISNNILDIGAGGGTFAMALKYLPKEIHVQEISDLCISNLKNLGFSPYTGNFSSIDFKKNFDLITCFHVLEHIKDLEIFYKALVKIANRFIAFEVPISRPLIKTEDEWDGHYHYFSKISLANYFSKDFEIRYLGDGVQMPCLLIILERK